MYIDHGRRAIFLRNRKVGSAVMRKFLLRHGFEMCSPAHDIKMSVIDGHSGYWKFCYTIMIKVRMWLGL